MKPCAIFLVSSLVGLASVQSFAQDKHSWGETFTCSVNWFAACSTIIVAPKLDSEKPKDKLASTISNLPFSQQRSNLPEPVRNVLENPSPETARAYVTWSRQANEKLATASEYIAEAAREINSQPTASRNNTQRSNEFVLAGLGPVGLYYFFSPGDQSATRDVTVLNKIWREGRLGVVGIPVRGNDDEVVNYMNEVKPLFPIRRSDTEVKVAKPTETPDLYLALPSEKKIFRLGPTITQTAISGAIGNILAAQIKGTPTLNLLASDR